MKLTIITVNLNNHVGFRKTAESIVSQSFQDYEWIVIDGGSNDGSKGLIEHYADHIAYWVSEPDKGIYNAMNKGIRRANGEYIMFLNSGDWFIDSGVLEKVFSIPFDEDVVYGYFKFDRGDYFEIKSSPKELTLRTFIEGTIHHTGNALIRRDGFEKWGLYDEDLRIVSDWKWFLTTIGLGDATTRYIDVLISVFDCNGISSINNNLCEAEREMVLKDLVPARILNDYMVFHQLDDQLYEQELQIRSSKAYRLGSFLLKPFKLLKGTTK